MAAYALIRNERSLPLPMSEVSKDDVMKPARDFRVAAVRLALGVLVALAAGAYLVLDRVAAQGVLLGGIAGVLGFWIMAVRLEKLASLRPERVHFAALTGTFFRLLLYGVVLYRAYALDTENMHGLLGAVVGILVIRFVAVFMGFTGMAMPDIPARASGDEPDGEARPDEPRE